MANKGILSHAEVLKLLKYNEGFELSQVLADD